VHILRRRRKKMRKKGGTKKNQMKQDIDDERNAPGCARFSTRENNTTVHIMPDKIKKLNKNSPKPQPGTATATTTQEPP
jgi:hypothetical protein